MQLTEVSINCDHICPQNLWLSANDMQVKPDLDLVAEVLIINATCPQRASKYRELDLGFMRFNHCEAKDKIGREGKKSKKMEAGQLTYY